MNSIYLVWGERVPGTIPGFDTGTRDMGQSPRLQPWAG